MAATVDMRAKMRFEADASQARAETASLQKAQADLAGGIAAAGRAAAAAGQQIDVMRGATRASAEDILRAVGSTSEMAAVAQIVRAAINPLVGEYNSLVQAQREISIAEGMGAISSREAALALDRLQREANTLVAAMEQAGVSIDGTTAAMTRQVTSAQQLINATTGISRATEESIADQLRHGMVLDDLRAKYNPLFAASRQYEQELRDIAEAERLGAISALEAAAARDRASAALAPLPNQLRQVGASSGAAAAYVGQLTFQMNDIFTMMAMGQAPFMLMVQQGPQVVQVFGQMRAAGLAIGPAIAGSFGMMLNPMSLATMAVIGFGAAAVQYFTSAGGKADEMGKKVDGLSGAIDDYSAASKAAIAPTEELIEKYGRAASAAREALQAIAERKHFEAIAQLNKVLGEYTRGINPAARGVAAAGANSMARQFGIDPDDVRAFVQLRRELELTDQAAADATIALDTLAAAKTMQDQLAAMQAFKDALDTSLPPYAEMTKEQRAVYDGIAESIEAMARLVGATSDASVEASNLAAEMSAVADAVDGITSAIAKLGLSNIGKAAQLTALQSGASKADAVVAGKVAEERERLKPALTSEESTISNTANIQLRNYEQALREEAGLEASIDAILDSRKPDKKKRGGTSETEKSAKALKDLIADQKSQIAILAELDPVQQEILKNHEALANATPKETAAVEDLIRKRQELGEVREKLDDIEQAGKGAFTGLISGAHGFSSAIGMVLSKLAEMAASDAWDMVWGSSGDGGFGLGDWVSGLLGLSKKADGGRVTGPGGPREDKVLMWGSNGEYMINAAATAANLPLIEAINAGASPDQLMTVMGAQRLAAHADGGMIGSSALPSWRAAATNASPASGAAPSGSVGGKLRVEFVPVVDKSGNLTSHIRTVSREEASDVVVEGLGTFSADILPGRIAEIDANPRERG